MAIVRRAISIGIAAIVVIGLIILVGFGVYLYDTFNGSPGTSSWISTATSSTLTTSKTPATPTCESTTNAVVENGTTFCADDVSNDTVVQNPGGYTYFLNGSITFMGVNFTAVCPQGFYGCFATQPSTANTSRVTTMLAGAVRLNLTFPDKTTETIGEIIGVNYDLTLLSKHTDPRAGIMLLDTHNGYEVFLLVQATSSLYNVAFVQTPVTTCNLSYLTEWSVTLGNLTKAQPPNATLPIPDTGWSAGTAFSNMSTITFSVPAGNYSYQIHPTSAFGKNSGTVYVNESDITVKVLLPAFPCTTTTGATHSSSSSSPAPSLTTIEAANVSIGGYPAEIAYYANTSSIYVSDLFANTVSVINSTSDSVVTKITMPGTPAFGIAVDPQSGIVLVPVAGCTNTVNSSNPCDSPHQHGSIVEISTKTNTIVGNIPIGVNDLVLDQNTDTIWAFYSESLYAINAQSGLLLANISLNADPVSIAVNPVTNMVYVAACGQMSLACGQAELFIFNGTSDSLKSTVSLSNYYDAINFNIVVDRSTNVVYVLGLGGPSMTLVSIGGISGNVLSSYMIGSSCAGVGGGNLAINAAGNQIYVSFESQSFFLVLNASTGHITSMFYSSGTVFDTIYNSQTKQIYLTTNGSLLVLSATSGTGYVNTNLLALGTCVP